MTAYGKVIANITNSPFYPASLNDTSMTLSINVSNADLQIVDRPGFMQLVSQLMLTPGATTYLSGVSSAWVSTQVGDILLTNITLPNQLIPLEGLNSFADLITINQPNNHVTGGFKWGLAMNLFTTINNPSRYIHLIFLLFCNSPLRQCIHLHFLHVLRHVLPRSAHWKRKCGQFPVGSRF